MRLQQYLKELFIAGHMLAGTGWKEIFVNPSKKEMSDAEKQSRFPEIRFIADIKKKNVYVHSSNLFHSVAWEQIRKETGDGRKIDNSMPNSLITGVAEKQGGKYVFTDSDWEFDKQIKLNPPDKWKFADKYILLTPTLQKAHDRQKKSKELMAQMLQSRQKQKELEKKSAR